MSKIDFKKTLDSFQARSHAFRVIDVPPRQYLKVDGHGNPNTEPAFTEAIEALFPLAYSLKFASKARDLDYVVPPLEGLWWAEDQTVFTSGRDQAKWDWTLMIMVPDWITQDEVAAALTAVTAKGNPPAALGRVRFETLHEGRCVQTMHVGSFAQEGGILATLHEEFMPANGLEFAGKHHEIYLSDFRKVAPEKQRTLLRQPVRPA